MAKIRLYLKPPRTNKADEKDPLKKKDGKCDVFICFTYRKVKKRYFLKESVRLKDIDPKLKAQHKLRLKNQVDGASYINPWLDTCESKANEIVRHLRIENPDYTLTDVTEQFEAWLKKTSKSSKDWTDAFKEWEKYMKETKKLTPGSIRAKRPLKALIANCSTGVEMFSERWMDRFVNFMVDNQSMEGSTVKKRVTHLREFLQFAINKKYPIPKDIISWKPSREIKMIHDKDSISITVKEYEQIRDAKLPTKHLEKIRDLMIVLSNSGQHFIDMMRISNDKIREVTIMDQDGTVRKINIVEDFRQKTGNRYTVPETRELRMILDKYDGKLPRISLDKFNQGLKELFTHLEITRLVKVENAKGSVLGSDMIPLNKYVSTKVVGRNLMTTRLEAEGVSPYLIAKILGQTNIKTQDIYKGTTPEMMEGLRKKIGG